jgi:hypothetical protein
MAFSANRLPSRFPVGTKFVIESRAGSEGQVYSRFLEFPDGTQVSLPSHKTRRKTGAGARRSRISRGRRH